MEGNMVNEKKLFRNIKYIFHNYNCKITSNNKHCNYYKIFNFFSHEGSNISYQNNIQENLLLTELEHKLRKVLRRKKIKIELSKNIFQVITFCCYSITHLL